MFVLSSNSKTIGTISQVVSFICCLFVLDVEVDVSWLGFGMLVLCTLVFLPSDWFHFLVMDTCRCAHEPLRGYAKHCKTPFQRESSGHRNPERGAIWSTLDSA